MNLYVKLILAAALLAGLAHTSLAREPGVGSTPGSSYATAIRVPPRTSAMVFDGSAVISRHITAALASRASG